MVGRYEGVTTARVRRRGFRRTTETRGRSLLSWRRGGGEPSASTEAREFAVTLVRRAGVRCVRAWRKHCVDKSAESRSLRRRYARVVTRRMARRLRQWRINAVHAIAARGSIAAANARVMERALNERYERYVFHAWRWHVAWSNGYAEAVSQRRRRFGTGTRREPSFVAGVFHI